MVATPSRCAIARRVPSRVNVRLFALASIAYTVSPRSTSQTTVRCRCRRRPRWGGSPDSAFHAVTIASSLVAATRPPPAATLVASPSPPYSRTCWPVRGSHTAAGCSRPGVRTCRPSPAAATVVHSPRSPTGSAAHSPPATSSMFQAIARAMRSSPAITSVSSGENATPRTPDDIPPSRGRVTRPRCTGCCRRPRRPQSTVRSGSRPSPWRTGIQRTTLRAGGDVVDHDTSTAPRRPRSRARQG